MGLGNRLGGIQGDAVALGVPAFPGFFCVSIDGSYAT
jgi:hypothetical protein